MAPREAGPYPSAATQELTKTSKLAPCRSPQGSGERPNKSPEKGVLVRKSPLRCHASSTQLSSPPQRPTRNSPLVLPNSATKTQRSLRPLYLYANRRALASQTANQSASSVKGACCSADSDFCSRGPALRFHIQCLLLLCVRGRLGKQNNVVTPHRKLTQRLQYPPAEGRGAEFVVQLPLSGQNQSPPP